MSTSRPSRFRPGPWLVGPAFLVHPLEEAATDFPLWIRATLEGGLDPVTFALVSTLGFVAVTGAVVLHRRRGPLPAVPAAVGTLFLLNATLHAAAALLTRGYVPGLVTGLLVWAPLGVVLLGEGREAGGRALGWGVCAGVTAHALASATALLG